MIFNAVIDGTPVNVELQSPTQLEFQIVQQQLEFQVVQPTLEFQVTQPAQLEFQVVQPQIMFPLEVGVTIPGPISGLTEGPSLICRATPTAAPGWRGADPRGRPPRSSGAVWGRY